MSRNFGETVFCAVMSFYAAAGLIVACFCVAYLLTGLLY